MKTIPLLFTFVCLLCFSDCKKEAGEGGTSFIQGKVYAKYYNKNFSVLADSGYAPDIDVYIIYGDEFSYSDRLRTSYDGSFEFKYLRKGNYKIFALSRDSTGTYKNQVNQFSPDIAVTVEAQINKSRERVEVKQIDILQ